MVGRTKRALASEILILHPPEKSQHFFCCIAALKPMGRSCGAYRNYVQLQDLTVAILIQMCLDIANDMEYLASMQFVYRDLAAR